MARIKRTTTESISAAVGNIAGAEEAAKQIRKMKENSTDEVKFSLSSGAIVSFKRKHIPANDVEKHTFVDEYINGRDQSGLTSESLEEIRKTITIQQFFPVIGFIDEKGKINILDGSRRRMAAILENVGLDALLAEQSIDVEDAKELARDIQTAKEHNLRELGFELVLLKNKGMNQKEIAKRRGLSEAKVTRALQAASVPSEMLSIFPDYSLLVYSEYKQLLNINNNLLSKNKCIDDLVAQVLVDIDKLDSSFSNEEMKEQIIRLFTINSNLMIAKPKPVKDKVKKLVNFDSKAKYARRKDSADGKKISFEFGIMPKNLKDELEYTITELIKKHEKNSIST